MPFIPFLKRVLTPAWIVGLTAFVCAGMLVWWDARLAAVPLALFVLLSLVMPFLPRVGYFGPVISRGSSGRRAVAVTFDDGPDPQTTPRLLPLLARHGVSATFFVTGKKADRHPALVRDTLDRGHAVGNHSYSHDYLLYFRNGHRLLDDIQAAQQALEGIGVTCRAFRPPAGIVPPRLHKLLQQTGLFLVNFSCRALDGGNRRVSGLAPRILRRVRPEDIILLHDIPPKNPATVDDWLEEVDRLLAGLRDRNLTILPLADLIGKPVMELSPDREKARNRLNL
jgi:peptidoglycan/xylan/chitin deacetylase (PgdA/CDA1 family)